LVDVYFSPLLALEILIVDLFFFFFLLIRLGNNMSGQYKRGVGMAFHIGVGNFAGAIAANIYRTKDSPRYVLGRAYLLRLWREAKPR
jgi:hypothetical protein